MKRVLIWVGGLLVLAVLLLQATRLSEESARADRLERQRDAAQSRADRALKLTTDTAAEIHLLAASGDDGAGVPAEVLRATGQRLEQEARVVGHGDPQLLDPAANSALIDFFDELL